jgi:hypothetical protein
MALRVGVALGGVTIGAPTAGWVAKYFGRGPSLAVVLGRGFTAALVAIYVLAQEICDYARVHGYVLLTNDLDFPRIIAHTKESKPSVVLLRGEPLTPEARGTALVQALGACESDLDQGCIVTVDWSDKPRTRVLPLG